MQALRAAQVYDGTAFLGAGTVLVDGERIVGVEPGYPEPPGDADVTTYAGTLLPGLIDCHVHLVSNGDIGALERAGAATDEELDAQIRESLAASAARGAPPSWTSETAGTGRSKPEPSPGCPGCARRGRR